MEFLVRIVVRWPPDGDPAERDRLIVLEQARAAELAREGKLVRLWRVPGRWANWGVWRCTDADDLHRILMSLPFAAWLDIEVHPLASHPSDPGPPVGDTVEEH